MSLLKSGPSHESVMKKDTSFNASELVFDAVNEGLDLQERA